MEQSGLASGVNNTFRQRGIAVGIAGLGAIFQHHVDGSLSPTTATAGLNSVFLVAAVTAFAGAAAAWPLMGQLRTAQ